MTNGDKIFKAVIEDSALISYGGYNPAEFNLQMQQNSD